MKKLILCSLYVILTSCSVAPTSESTQTAPSIEQNKEEMEQAASDTKPAQSIKGKAGSCICVKLWMPVCGANKKTYGNACEADCAGVKYTGGACAETK
jgi:hypothetical protein